MLRFFAAAMPPSFIVTISFDMLIERERRLPTSTRFHQYAFHAITLFIDISMLRFHATPSLAAFLSFGTLLLSPYMLFADML